MTNSTTLQYPDVLDPNNSYHVVLDASKWGFGATLSQEQEGHRYTVAYFSHSLPNHKREWGQTKLEFECLYAALRHWKLFLYNTHFRIVTDCKSLLNWQTIFSKNNPTMIRKFQELSTFRFDIQHKSGKENVVTDFLSRYPHLKYSVNKETQTDSISVNSLSDASPTHDPVLLPSNTPALVIDIFPPPNGTTQTTKSLQSLPLILLLILPYTKTMTPHCLSFPLKRRKVMEISIWCQLSKLQLIL